MLRKFLRVDLLRGIESGADGLQLFWWNSLKSEAACLRRPPLAQRISSPAACSQLPSTGRRLAPLLSSQGTGFRKSRGLSLASIWTSHFLVSVSSSGKLVYSFWRARPRGFVAMTNDPLLKGDSGAMVCDLMGALHPLAHMAITSSVGISRDDTLSFWNLHSTMQGLNSFIKWSLGRIVSPEQGSISHQEILTGCGQERLRPQYLSVDRDISYPYRWECFERLISKAKDWSKMPTSMPVVKLKQIQGGKVLWGWFTE